MRNRSLTEPAEERANAASQKGWDEGLLVQVVVVRKYLFSKANKISKNPIFLIENSKTGQENYLVYCQQNH